MSLESITPAHLTAHIKSTIGRSDSHQPAFTLIIGAGFSHPLVPLTSKMMRDEIGSWYNDTPEPVTPELKRKLTAEFWRRFNKENQEHETGCRVDLDDDGLPTDPTAAYQTVSKAKAIGGIGTVQDARAFLRAMVAKSRGRLNGAHFFLAALLDAQRREQLIGKRPFCRTIFTTNFDSLLQSSLQLMGVLYYMTDRPELPLDPGHLIEDDDAIHLIYTHGSVHRPYLANTEEELRRLCTANSPIFAPYLESHGVIVVGYSGWDDSLVAALERCTNFAGNLYWCDVISKPDAIDRLSEFARRLLTNDRGRRFYVPLGTEGADGLMGLLFQTLVRDQGFPRLLIDPFVGVADQLNGLSLDGLTMKRYVPGAAPEPGSPETLTVSADELRSKAVDLLKDASHRLLSGMWGHGKARPDVSRYLISAALERALAGRLDRAITLFDTAIEQPDVPADQLAMAHFNRGVAYGLIGDGERELADYTRVIELPGAPPEQVARALNNRGVAYRTRGDAERAIADYVRVIELPGAPPDQVALALNNRGIAYSKTGDTQLGIADFTRVIELTGAPPEQVAGALNNRGWSYYGLGEGDAALFLADAEASVGLAPTPNTLANLALARLFAGHDATAIDAYRRFLEASPSREDVEEARADIRAAAAKWLAEARATPILALLDTK